MKQLQEEIKILDSKISQIFHKNNKSEAIKDGAVNLNQYLNSKYKIAWVLKEVNSDSDEGGWDLRDALKNLKTESGIKKGWARTFAPIIYTTFGIINEKLWEEIPNYWDEPEIVEVLNKIVYLNIKKTTGGNVANHQEIIEFYQDNKNIFLQQLKLYNPSIIIFGNTFQYVKNDLNTEDFKITEYKNSNLCVYSNNDKIYLDAYHPAARIKKENYVNDIISAVLTWLKRKK